MFDPEALAKMMPGELFPPELRPRVALIPEVLREMHWQDSQWGQQDHGHAMWNLILTEEVGEVAKACIETHEISDMVRDEHVRNELIQVAAVAMQWILAIDRKDYPEEGDG